MITLKKMASQFYNLFKNVKPTPKVRHLRILTWGDDVVFQGSCMGTQGLYTMDIRLRKDEEGKVSYLSPVSDIFCGCPAFKYYVQDPLAKARSAEPTGHVNMRINNPKQIPAPCKHLYAYIQYIMTRGLITQANMRSAKSALKDVK